jgi:hypothetical protein
MVARPRVVARRRHAYCVDVMKEICAVQSALERTNRVMLHNHLETCFSQAVLGGRGAAAIEELVTALKFSAALTGPDACLSAGTVPTTPNGHRKPPRSVNP